MGGGGGVTALDMEIILSDFFYSRSVSMVIPNVYWAFGHYEKDLVVITKAGYAWEVEIKVSRADLIKDKDKRHKHNDNKIKFLYFAIPKELESHIEHIPEGAGIITVSQEDKSKWWRGCEIIREPLKRNDYKLSTEEQLSIARLSTHRMWVMKKKMRASI